MKQISRADNMRNKYTPSPVFSSLADFYISPNAFVKWSYEAGYSEKVEFKHKVKQYMIDYINQSLEPYVKNLPFLKIDLPHSLTMLEDYELSFYKELREYLEQRRIVRVVAHNSKGSYIIPLSTEELQRRVLGKLYDAGGFEINLEREPLRRMLTSFSHEIGHTYCYDISSDCPKCLVSDRIRNTRQWYKEFEGLAFDFGREILLPRKAFAKYVCDKYKHPSLENFFKMYMELNVSRDILSQRLLRDLRLWNACVFWGKVSYKDLKAYGSSPSPYIFVRHRDIRKGGFRNLSIPAELNNPNSQLCKTIFEDGGGENPTSYSVKLKSNKYTLDIKSQPGPHEEKYFTAMLYR